MEKKIKIEKGSVQETLIVPLYGRKMCTEKFPELYKDIYAKEICESIDYDFGAQIEKENTFAYKYGAVVAAMRQLDMSWEIKEYLKKYPKAAVVNIGCGLDQTGRTCDNGTCRLYNVDFPDIIKIREDFFDTLEREKNIPADINDHSWLEKIDGKEGVIFFASGVFHYFKTEEVRSLVLKMSERFPGGCLVFDTVGKTGRNLMMKKILKNMDMGSVKGYFYVNNVKKQLEGWSDKIKITHRGYMLGYHDMKGPGLKASYRLLGRIGDGLMKMRIIKIEFIG